jgi:superoxide dismutase, Fe-Mn family
MRQREGDIMTISVKPLLFKPHRLNGLSDKLLVSHYENNYGGALRRLNAIQAKLAEFEWPAAPVFEINGTKREELIASGSVILHEIYFDALGGEGGDPPAGIGLAEALERDFGSLRAWHTEFTAIAKDGLKPVSIYNRDRVGPPIATTTLDFALELRHGARSRMGEA